MDFILKGEIFYKEIIYKSIQYFIEVPLAAITALSRGFG